MEDNLILEGLLSMVTELKERQEKQVMPASREETRNPLKTLDLSQVSFPLLFPLCYIFPYKFTNSDKGQYKGTESFDVYSQTKLSLIVRVTAWLLAIPDTLFFQPTFPFSDYCLKRGKAQSATDRPKKS